MNNILLGGIVILGIGGFLIYNYTKYEPKYSVNSAVVHTDSIGTWFRFSIEQVWKKNGDWVYSVYVVGSSIPDEVGAHYVLSARDLDEGILTLVS